MGDPKDQQRPHQSLRGLDAVITLGAEIAVPTFLGYWADAQLGWTPALTLAGVTLGFGAGLYHFIRRVMPPKSAKDSRGTGAE